MSGRSLANLCYCYKYKTLAKYSLVSLTKGKFHISKQILAMAAGFWMIGLTENLYGGRSNCSGFRLKLQQGVQTMKISLHQVEHAIGTTIKIASSRAALASMLIWCVAGAIWWQALA